MDEEKGWKILKRDGGVRRKVLKECENILKLNLSHEKKRKCMSAEQTTCRETQGSVEEIQSCSNDVFVEREKDEDKEDCDTDEEEYCSVYMQNIDFSNKLRSWALKRNISQTALKDLAVILNERIPNIVPSDPRTILRTARNIELTTFEGGGEYWHHGLIIQLEKLLQEWQNVPNVISLNINIDGLPIHKSSKKEFWPILFNIFEKPNLQPFIIGIYFGVGKPKDLNEYLCEFVKEAKILLENGIYVKHCNKKVMIRIRCFICDSPARAYVKGVWNFNGKHGCLKCTTVGEYSHLSHTVVFLDTKCPDRTDEDFRKKVYGLHHKIDSPLLQLNIDMVQDFPVADSLHLIDLGVMKRLLIGWRSGNFGKYITKWCAKDIDNVSSFLIKCKMPTEIHRSVRGLDCLAHWKASEFRTFLYYCSVIILPEVLRQDAYYHFLTLFCAITICSATDYTIFHPLAKELLKYFVEHYKDFYSADYVTSNIHNLIHVTDEVKKFGTLNTFNAYPFENKLYLIKNMLRQGNRPLSQVAKRLSEDNRAINPNIGNKETSYPIITTTVKNLPKIHFEHFVLSSKKQDKYLMTKKNYIVEIKSISNDKKSIRIHGYIFNNKRDIFDKPIRSSLLNIFQAKISDVRSEIVITCDDVKCKLVAVEHNATIYFVPLLHSL